MTVTSLMMSTPPTMNNRAKVMGQPLISASKRPELDDRMRSRDFEKWWVQSNPDSRCATENEKRAWNRLTASPNSALNKNAPIMMAHNKMRNRSGVSMPIELVTSKARLR